MGELPARLRHAGDLSAGHLLDNHAYADKIKDMAEPSHRHITFDGTRRTNSRRDASYKVVDATGLTDEDVQSKYGMRGPAPSGVIRPSSRPSSGLAST